MKKIFIGGLALAVLGLLAIEVPAQGLIPFYFACVNDRDGSLYIVPPNTTCKRNETLIWWPANDQDTLLGLSETCSAGQVPKYNGSTWTCAADVDTNTDTLAGLGCSAGQVPKYNGTNWICAADADTNTDTLGALVCAAGQVPKRNGAGAWVCGTDQDTLGTLACATGAVPLRAASGAWVCGTIAPDQDTLASLNCTSGQSIKWNGTAWVCDPSARFVDNGDGTISDTKTGLMWEKKNSSNVNHVYAWSCLEAWPPGACVADLFSTFLKHLNDLSIPNDGQITSCYAGYCDWRLPTVGELRGILTDPYLGCLSDPCIHPIFGPTESASYWTSTNFQWYPFNDYRLYSEVQHIYTVNFMDGWVDTQITMDPYWVDENHVWFTYPAIYARAVRGGR